MEPTINEVNKQKTRPFAAGVVALAAFSLLAGASVSAALVDYAAPEYAEEDPFVGAVDDLTGEDTWEEKHPEKAEKGPRALVGKVMKHRIDKVLEDREEHLEQRITVNRNLIAAFQYCLDKAECDADQESLLEMSEKLSFAVQGMQAKLDGVDPTDDETDDGQEACESAGGTWTEAPDRGEGLFYCASKDEMPHESKEEDWEERKKWDEEDRVAFAEKRLLQLRVAESAISFCIDNEGCDADAQILETAVTHMTHRANHLRECADDRRCDRDHDHRKGAHDRIRGAFCKVSDNCDDRDKREHVFEVTFEADCEKRGGSWTEAPDREEGQFYCDYPDRSSDERNDDDSAR